MIFLRFALPVLLAAAASRADSIFVSDERGDDLRVLSSESHGLIATIPVGKRPRGMCLSPDGKTVYVALGDEARAVDVAPAAAAAIGS